MNYEEALRKAALCLKLAQSSNTNEAALAASKAQEIIDRYQLDVNQLGYDSAQEKLDAEPIVDYGYGDPLDVSPYSFAGHIRLASTISRHNGCRIILCREGLRGKKFRIVGRPRDVQTARYMYAMLKSEADRLTKACCNAGHSAGYRNQFYIGVVDAITTKLEETRKATFQSLRTEHSNNPMALVRVNNAIAKMENQSLQVHSWMKEKIPGLRATRAVGSIGSEAGYSGREHGRREGASIRISKASGSLGSGRKALQ